MKHHESLRDMAYRERILRARKDEESILKLANTLRAMTDKIHNEMSFEKTLELAEIRSELKKVYEVELVKFINFCA